MLKLCWFTGNPDTVELVWLVSQTLISTYCAWKCATDHLTQVKAQACYVKGLTTVECGRVCSIPNKPRVFIS